MRFKELKLTELNVSHTLGSTDKSYRIPYCSYRRHKSWLDTKDVRKTPKDLSVCKSEECGRVRVGFLFFSHVCLLLSDNTRVEQKTYM